MGEATRSAEEAAGEVTPAVAATKRLINLRSAALVAEIVGGLAVIVSLIFVGVQLAQANKLERNAAMQRHVEAVTNLQTTAIERPALIEAFRKAAQGEELSIPERINVESFLMYSDRTGEGLYLQYLDGQIEPDLWEAHRAQGRPLHNSPTARAVWAARRMWFTPRYRAFRDNELATGTGEQLNYDYFEALEKPPTAAPPPAEMAKP
jgi:hypothetical protein